MTGGLIAGCSGGGGTTQSSPSPTTALLTASSNAVNVGATVTLTCSVQSLGAPVTSGSVTFYDGTNSLSTSSLNSAGQAAWSSSSLVAGTHDFSCSFAGSSAFQASTSSQVGVTVSQPLLSTTTVLTVGAASLQQGLPVRLSAQILPSTPSSMIPTGSVSFADGSATLGTAAVDPTGIANFTSTQLAMGENSVVATYLGDTTFSGSAAQPGVITVTEPPGATYTNPLKLNVSGTVPAVSCADPAIYKDQQNSVNTWYLYCTSDALYAGDPNPHFINIFHSSDLVNWTYNGNAFPGLPSWANGSGASFWAPAIKYFNGRYILYYAASATALPGSGSAIGVGTSSSPAGPFVDAGAPVVEPELAANCCSGAYRSTIDPDEIQDSSGQRYILFGSFAGGLYVRKLSADGLTSDKNSEQQVAVDNRYEGGNWWFHDGYYYLFASSTNCCNGPLSGYGVFVGRSLTPLGPYLDSEGISLLSTAPGGTPVISMNGNSVLGPGGNVVFTDEAGRDYLLYHGILAGSPYYAGSVGYTARPGFLDAIDWVNGWPVVRGGFGASDSDAPQPVPAAQPGMSNGYAAVMAAMDAPGSVLQQFSDDFGEPALSSQWTSLHSTPTYSLANHTYQVNSVSYDPVSTMQNVPLLCESAPAGDYMVETELDLNLPTSGAGPDYAQAGLILYGDDSDFVRLDLYNNNDTRQVEFIKAEKPEASGYPTWGATNVGSAAINSQVTAWLRIVKKNVNGTEQYTAYSSNDGATWVHGGTWVHQPGSAEKVCLYAGNRSGFTGTFHYVHVSTVQ